VLLGASEMIRCGAAAANVTVLPSWSVMTTGEAGAVSGVAVQDASRPANKAAARQMTPSF